MTDLQAEMAEFEQMIKETRIEVLKLTISMALPLSAPLTEEDVNRLAEAVYRVVGPGA